MNKISFHEIEAKLQGGPAFQKAEPTTTGMVKNKRVDSKFALLGPDTPQNMRLESYVRMV